MECRLDLRAAGVAELISTAGGWICDRVLAGWTVTVCVPQHAHDRSLTILGVNVQEWTDEYDGEVCVLLLSGEHRAAGHLHRVCHRLSAAARAFKTQAMLAAGLPPAVASSEEFLVDGPLNLLAAAESAAPVASAVQTP
jgi:hypothetical protein